MSMLSCSSTKPKRDLFKSESLTMLNYKMIIFIFLNILGTQRHYLVTSYDLEEIDPTAGHLRAALSDEFLKLKLNVKLGLLSENYLIERYTR